MKTDRKDQVKEAPPCRTEGRISVKYYKEKAVAKIRNGEIFEVKNKSTQALFHCKRLLKSKIVDMDRFNKEASIALKIDHPNIQKTLDIFEDEKYIYLILEPVIGQTLFEKINADLANGAQYSEKKVSSIFKQMISAISNLQAQGMNFKDVSPDNFVFVGEETEENPQVLKLVNIATTKLYGELKTVGRRTGNEKESKNNYNPAARTYNPILVPPELLQGSYEDKSDVWVLGVLLYIMISGNSPFNGNTQNEIFKMVSRKKASFHDQFWKGVSDECKDLIKHIICDIQNRLTAQQVLDHDWVAKNAPNAGEVINDFNAESFKRMGAPYNFKKALVELIGEKIDDGKVALLKNKFDEIKAEDNLVTLAQVKEELISIGIEEEAVNNCFSLIDMEGEAAEKKIDFNEFIQAAVDILGYKREEEMIRLFKIVDMDGEGKLPKKVIKDTLIKAGTCEEMLDKLVQGMDLDGEGELDLNEFLKTMARHTIFGLKVEDTKENLGKGGSMRGSTLLSGGIKASTIRDSSVKDLSKSAVVGGPTAFKDSVVKDSGVKDSSKAEVKDTIKESIKEELTESVVN